MNKIEKLVISLVACLLLAIFTYSSYVNFFGSNLDSAVMVGNIEETHSSGLPVSQLNASSRKAVDAYRIIDNMEWGIKNKKQ